MTNIFTAQLGKEIADIFRDRGWNIYASLQTPFQTIKAGPVSQLEEAKYVVLPSCNDPRNDSEVISAAQMMGAPYLEINGEVVVIEEDPRGNRDIRTLYSGNNLIFVGFTTTPRNLELLSEWRLIFPYEIFINSLDGLADASNITIPEEGPKTWDEVNTFDDIVQLMERKLISELIVEKPCPHLKLSGRFWHYCGNGMTKPVYKKPSPNHPIYTNHVGTAELQLFCDTKFKNCIKYKEEIKLHFMP